MAHDMPKSMQLGNHPNWTKIGPNLAPELIQRLNPGWEPFKMDQIVPKWLKIGPKRLKYPVLWTGICGPKVVDGLTFPHPYSGRT